MRAEFLPFSRPSISKDDIDAVVDVLRSGWITTGRKNIEFEEKFCEYIGCSGAVALASATAGMHLALHTLGIGTGDEVITPSMTWVSTANLIVLSGATPVFADIDRNTLMISVDSIKECISDRTRLIIPVHFAGAPVDMEPVCRLGIERDIAIIEDAAHSLGTKYKGEYIGKKGASIFSFHPIKNITTGEGGMFCSDDKKLLEQVRRLKFHGLGVDAYDRYTQGRSPQAQVLEPGYKYNMTDISAALGISQLSRIDEFNKKRSELSARYQERLTEVDEILPLSDPLYDMNHSRHLFIVRLDIEKAGFSRNYFMEELKKRNIGTGIHFMAIHLQRYYMESLGMRRGMLPNTEWNSDRMCSLPLFPEMTIEDVDCVVDSIKKLLRNNKS
ncbi:MAG: UDP-4-amino-4-deoxy-L-arabinose aminotransferase [Deltaproteobacteria bacterium]|nr:UDP-4-amino-4-deoxy-L-arabinose aminotransferase [Deltaproteobacteria bacterium]